MLHAIVFKNGRFKMKPVRGDEQRFLQMCLERGESVIKVEDLQTPADVVQMQATMAAYQQLCPADLTAWLWWLVAAAVAITIGICCF